MGGEQILSQEDVDALLAGGGDTEQEGESNLSQEAQSSFGEEDKKVVTAAAGRSEFEVKKLLSSLCRKAHVQRDSGVKVIWNALGLFPLTPGYNMQIQGRNYVTLGCLSNAHLVVGLTDP